MDPLRNYLENYLTPRLLAYGVRDSYIKYTTEIIDLQATSLLRNWGDTAFRKAVLLLGSEEGPFYEPAGKVDIKCFVVVAIRNSPIETIQSQNYSDAGLSASIPDDGVKSITGEAIRYFNAQNFDSLCREAVNHTQVDFYRDTVAKYPVTWAALWHLALTSAKITEYKRMEPEAPYEIGVSAQQIAQVEEHGAEKVEMVKSVFDAYSPDMDPALLRTLERVGAESNGLFVADSFKTVSRNFEKLLKILEYLLTRGGVFASSNYYLENGHVERRIKPLKAAHTYAEMEHNLSQLKGLGHKHAAALKHLAK